MSCASSTGNTTQPFAIPYANVTVIDTPAPINAPHKSLGLIFGIALGLLEASGY